MLPLTKGDILYSTSGQTAMPGDLALGHNRPSLQKTLSTPPQPLQNVHQPDTLGSTNSQETCNTPELNSYKFSKPRVYVKNDFPSADKCNKELLREISLLLGNKAKPLDYDNMINNLLAKNKKKAKKTKGIVNLNVNNYNSGTMRMVSLDLNGKKISALADTGSSHCLITTEFFAQLTGANFENITMLMRVAGSTLKDNIVGKTNLILKVCSSDNKIFEYPQEFLIAHNLNNYDSILGANFLLNPEITVAITPKSLLVKSQKEILSIPLIPQVKGEKSHSELLFTESEKIIPENETFTISVPCPNLVGSNAEIISFKHYYPITERGIFVNSVKFDDCNQNVLLELHNSLNEQNILYKGDCLGELSTSTSAGGVNSTNVYSCEINNQDITHPEFTKDIEDEAAEELVVVDPTNLDKKFSYKDCTVGESIPQSVQKSMWEILKKHKSVFATSKLDVGTFKGFVVQIEIDKELPHEQQRYMSPEKVAYCKKTFQTFEKLDLIRECNNPKTISNLHLVPKYEGLRDLTKASTFLAQIRGEKNHTFRIVQDLRRINANTKNVKKSQPVLPESIFARMQNKIVSSIDANQAYWHLVLDPASRPYTCFYLGKKTYQYNRMAQGLMNAPACWDEAMSVIFSEKTMSEVKKLLGPEKASKLPDNFEPFFAHYQDDSWIISDNNEDHLLHCEAVILAYKLHDIKISPQKCTFFAKELKVLGVSVMPGSSELALDAVKANSILSWEKPDSLYTLQSRLYSLNYWQKFIPCLSELKFPLNQILRSGVFSWDKHADEAWQRIKALIALDIKLTIPEKHEQLILTTDASKIAISCILWVEREGDLKVVGCYSKLFSHTDSLKSIYFKETYALVEGFRHFRPYLLNSSKSIVVFTDARSLIWVSRNREYSIACNGLVNKLAKLQLEIPHVVYSVPSEVNYLADMFSRAYSESRFLEKENFSLSKVQAGKIPPLTNPCILSENALYIYFSTPLNPEQLDNYAKTKGKIQTPRPIKNLYKLFKDCTPEQKYYSALRLLQGWNDKNLSKRELASLNIFELVEKTDQKVAEKMRDEFIELVLNKLYPDIDPGQRKRIKATFQENMRKFSNEEVVEYVQNKFMDLESILNSVEISETAYACKQPKTVIYYSKILDAEFQPKIAYNSPGIDLPLQQNLKLSPSEKEIVDTGIRILIPPNYFGLIKARSSTGKLDITVFSGVIDNDYSGNTKLIVKNCSDETLHFEKGTYLAQMLIIPVLHPLLEEKSEISVKTERGIGSFGSSTKTSNRQIPGVRIPLTEGGVGHVSEPGVRIPLTEGSFKTQISDPPPNLILEELKFSPIHEVRKKFYPEILRINETNTKIMFPDDHNLSKDIWRTIRDLEIDLLDTNCNAISVLFDDHEDFIGEMSRINEDLMYERSLIVPYLKNYKCNLMSVSAHDGSAQEDAEIDRRFYENSILEMSKKLAVISVDYLKNKLISAKMLARCQISDPYLNKIYEVCSQSRTRIMENYHLTNRVLYKRIWDSELGEFKHCIALPDILLPSVVHNLHHKLSHPSATATLKNFQSYYYNRNATKVIKEYVRNCMTCSLAGKIDVRKILSGDTRTMNPTAPRQCLYVDILPCPKGQFSHILFCVDAYSQYIMTVPLRDKSSASVYQGLLSILSTAGAYSHIYFDNESSFYSAANLLVKMLPIKVHFSVPYAHFQNSAETHVKIFKKYFLKGLFDDDSPNAVKLVEWDKLLPTVTQSINRQIILSLGVT